MVQNTIFRILVQNAHFKLKLKLRTLLSCENSQRNVYIIDFVQIIWMISFNHENKILSNWLTSLQIFGTYDNLQVRIAAALRLAIYERKKGAFYARLQTMLKINWRISSSGSSRFFFWGGKKCLLHGSWKVEKKHGTALKDYALLVIDGYQSLEAICIIWWSIVW